jgi:hypothetical protein
MRGQIIASKLSFSTLLENTQVKRFRTLLDPTKVHTFNSTPLGRLYDHLLAFFAQMEDFELDMAKLLAKVALPTSLERNMAAQIINYGYCTRYQEDDTLIDIAGYELERSPSNIILVAVQELRGSKVVLGTFRIAWDNLEVFQLFEVPTGTNWPHQTFAQKPGEAGKCSMHPILDLLSTSSLPDLSLLGNAYKAMVFTMMWELALKLFKDNQIGCMYYIASPRAQQFFSRMGIRSTHCEGALPSTTQEAQRLRREWWQYFKPAELPENQSGVYYCPVESQ